MKTNNRTKSLQLLNNTKVFAIGNIFAKACQYILITLCTYKLTKAEYGVSDTVIQTAAMFVPIFSLDISEAVFRFSMDKDSKNECVYSNALLVGIIGLIVLLLLFPLFCLIPFFNHNYIYIIILTIFEFLQIITKEYVRGIGKTHDYMVGGILDAVCQILGCLLFVYLFNLRLLGYILALSFAYLCEIIFYYFKLNIYKSISYTYISSNICKKLLKYSVPLTPNTIMWWIIGASDRYFILWIINEAATGLYAVAAKFPALISIVTSIFFKAWEINAIEDKDTEEREEFYNMIINLLLEIMAILLSLAIVVIKPVIMIMVSPEFREGWVFAPFLLLAATFSLFQTFFGVNYTVEKDSIGTLKSSSFAAVFNLILNYVLIKNIGIQGATISTAISYFAVAIYRYFDTKKYINTKVNNAVSIFFIYFFLIL